MKLKNSLIQGVIAVAAGWVGMSVAAEGPVKVFILSGQSNMVGAERLMAVEPGGEARCLSQWCRFMRGNTMQQLIMTPLSRSRLSSWRALGVEPTAYPGGGVQVVRGMVLPKETGVL